MKIAEKRILSSPLMYEKAPRNRGLFVWRYLKRCKEGKTPLRPRHCHPQRGEAILGAVEQMVLYEVVVACEEHGRAAVVLPDNVLFKGGARETIHRELLKQANVHTLRRLTSNMRNSITGRAYISIDTQWYGNCREVMGNL